jgi:AhpD family alkylhydroperoxidase
LNRMEVRRMSEDAMKAMEELQEELPGLMQAFMEMHGEVFSEGALSVKVKRLIMVGASVALRCEPCIRVHVRGALEAGASREEILEAASAGILMGGGPSAAYTALYLKDELDQAQQA